MPDTVQVGIIDVEFDPAVGNVIRASASVTFGLTVENYVMWTVSNQHNDWVDVICETVDGGDQYTLFQTGHLNVGESVSGGKALALSAKGRDLHIFRWTPGLFGLPGSGGGEARFTMPDSGFIKINITVAG